MVEVSGTRRDLEKAVPRHSSNLLWEHVDTAVAAGGNPFAPLTHPETQHVETLWSLLIGWARYRPPYREPLSDRLSHWVRQATLAGRFHANSVIRAIPSPHAHLLTVGAAGRVRHSVLIPAASGERATTLVRLPQLGSYVSPPPQAPSLLRDATTPLSEAARLGDRSFLKHLLQQRPPADLPAPESFHTLGPLGPHPPLPVMHLLALSPSSDAVLAWADETGDPEAGLARAVQHGSHEDVRLWLERADVNRTHPLYGGNAAAGQLPLAFALRESDSVRRKWLIPLLRRAGARWDAGTEDGMPVLAIPQAPGPLRARDALFREACKEIQHRPEVRQRLVDEVLSAWLEAVFGNKPEPAASAWCCRSLRALSRLEKSGLRSATLPAETVLLILALPGGGKPETGLTDLWPPLDVDLSKPHGLMLVPPGNTAPLAAPLPRSVWQILMLARPELACFLAEQGHDLDRADENGLTDREWGRRHGHAAFRSWLAQRELESSVNKPSGSPRARRPARL